MKTKKGKILVNGSVVLDTIFKKEFFGGTGANIAYGLGKLKTSPLLFSLVGGDFSKNFSSHLKKSGVDLRVCVEKKGQTACFTLEVDDRGGYVNDWQANTYKNIHKIAMAKNITASELKKVSIAIFSPGTPVSILKHLREFRKLASNALAIFDPGQMITHYSKKQFTNCLNLADILILNELEYKQITKILKKDPALLFKNKIIIKTLGERGSLILENGKRVKIQAVRPKKVLDTTGAGDAYRAGLIFGLWQGATLPNACTLGARLASKNIEYIGCQQYEIGNFVL